MDTTKLSWADWLNVAACACGYYLLARLALDPLLDRNIVLLPMHRYTLWAPAFALAISVVTALKRRRPR